MCRISSGNSSCEPFQSFSLDGALMIQLLRVEERRHEANDRAIVAVVREFGEA